MKNNSSIQKAKFWLVNAVLLVLTAVVNLQAQMSVVSVPQEQDAAPPPQDLTWWYIMLFVLAVGLAGAVFWWMNSKKAQAKAVADKVKAHDERISSESNALDADKELEWLRKNPLLTGKKTSKTPKKRPVKLPETNDVLQKNGAAEDYMPIFLVERLEFAKPFDNLPISDDEALISAIEQTHDEFEEDEEVRDLALRILKAFRTRNSVEALAEIALYDLSSNLRSRAVTILSEFDHESVFDTILLACAEPTREVRAAAARGLTKLTFDRADAWTRIIETEEEGRIVQAARAAIESGFVDMSFDRLIHQDRKYAYEAFTLMALLIKAGETKKIFHALENHRNINVRRAVLHVVKTTKNQKALEGLYSLLEKNALPIEFQEEVDRAIEEIGFVTV